MDSDAMQPALELCGALSYSSLLINAPGLDGQSQLHSAAERGDVDEVVRLLSEGANAFMRDEGGVTPISLAQANHHVLVAEAFDQWEQRVLHAFVGVTQAGDLEAVQNFANNTVLRSEDEVSVLCAAVSHGQKDVTDFLLAHFSFERKDLEEALLLRQSAISESAHLLIRMDPVEASLRRALGYKTTFTPEAIIAFARDGEWPSKINVRSGNAERTALHNAAEDGATRGVLALLHLGADVFSVDGDGGVARQLAFTKGHADVVELLDDWQQAILDHLMNLATQGDVAAIRTFNKHAGFPYQQKLQMLGAVAESGRIEMMRELLHGKHFADKSLATLSELASVSPDMKNAIDSRRLYDQVNRWSAEDISAFLMSHPGVDTNVMWDGRTAAHALADSTPEFDHADKFRALKDAGADFSLRTDGGHTAQQYLDHWRNEILLADI